MESWLLILILLGTFGFGFWAVVRLGAFMDKNPGAFPRKRHTTVPPPKIEVLEDACIPCYNGSINSKEMETDEECDP